MQEEISLQDLILRLWERRGIPLAILLLTALVVCAWTLLVLGFGSRDLVYHIDLKGIEKGQYPGGAAFSPNDLRGPEVLRSAAEASGLNVQRLEQISRGLSIEHGSPETAGIVQKYRERLSARNLSAAEIDARNAQFKEELELATQSSVRLVLSPSVSGLGVGPGMRLLQEIPAQWSKIYSERYRIYEAPGLKKSAVTLGDRSLSQAAANIAAIRVLSVTEKGLDTMANDNRISHLVNSSGLSASELLERFYVFRDTEFRPLSIAVVGKRGPVADSYRSDLRLRIDALDAQIESYTLMAEQLFSGREGAAGDWAQSADSGAINQLQVSGDSLGVIIDLAERASSVEFVREILMERHELAKDLAEAKAQLAWAESASSFEPSEDFTAAVEQSFASLAREYEDLYSVSIAKLKVELGTLYSASAAPMKVGEVDFSRLLMRAVGALLAALFVSILVAFILPDRQAAAGPASS